MTFQSTTYAGRQVFVGEPSDVLDSSFVTPFVALVVASTQKELDEVLSVAGDLLGLGCKEFCCMGLMAELLHDQLDVLIERAGLFDVVTTWHEDTAEGCEYFLYGAGGQGLALYGLISRHQELLDAMALAV